MRVLILGATGNAGRMAVQVCKRLCACEVTAAGRDPDRPAGLPAPGADRTLRFGVRARAVLLARVERAWNADAGSAGRTVLVP